MICSKSIVECLRDSNVYPTVFAIQQSSSKFAAENVLNYESNNYYDSDNENSDKYLGVDFKQTVSIASYQIKTPSN